MSQLARNVLSLYVARAAQVAGALVLFPLVIAYVGLDQYGIWLLATSVATIVVTSDFGVGTAVVRYVAQTDAAVDPRRVSEAVSSALAFFVCLGVVAAVLFGVAITAAWPGLGIESADRDVATQLFVLAAVGMLLLGIPVNMFRQVLVGLHRFDVANGIVLAQVVGRVALMALVLVLGGGIVGAAIAEVAVTLVTGLAAAIACHRLVPEMRLRRRLVSLPLLRSLAPYSLQVFVMGAAALVILHVDNLIIGLFLPVSAVALYGAAFRIYWTLRELTGAIMNAVMPETARAQATGDDQRTSHLLIRGTKYANATVLLAGVPALVLAEPLLVAWLGERFAEVAVVGQVLVLSLLVNNNHLAAVGVLMGTGRIGRFTLYHVIWAVANVALSVALIGPLGLTGVALGTLVPLLVLEPLYVRTALRELGVPARDFLLEGVLKPYVPAVMAAVPLLIFAGSVQPTGLMAVGACGIGFGALYLAFFAWTALDSGELERLVLGPARRTRAAAGRLVPSS